MISIDTRASRWSCDLIRSTTHTHTHTRKAALRSAHSAPVAFKSYINWKTERSGDTHTDNMFLSQRSGVVTLKKEEHSAFDKREDNVASDYISIINMK